MSVLCLNVCRLYVPNIVSLGMFFKNCTLPNLAHLLDTASKLRYFRRSVWKTKSWQKSKRIQKLKHANSILESFEYFCQISSKSIFIILSYTISNLTRFFETRCIAHITKTSVCDSISISRIQRPLKACFRLFYDDDDDDDDKCELIRTAHQHVKVSFKI